MEQKEFKDQFRLSSDFTEPVCFTDDNLGFSTFKEYPNGYASLFKIYIRKEELLKENELKILEASVSYGKKSENGIILSSSSEKIKGLFDPIDLTSSDEFSFNFKTKKFFRKNKEIEANKVLELLDKWHIKTTKPLKNIWLITKLLWFHYILTGFWKFIFGVLAVLHYLVSGEKIKIFDDLKEPQNYGSPRLKEPLNIEKSELIDLWGYKVKPWIAGIYSALHIFIYLILYKYNYRPEWLVTIFKNNFLTLVYGILSLGLANTILPILLKPINLKGPLAFIQSAYLNTAFKKLKI